jgi:hypothetical protein
MLRQIPVGKDAGEAQMDTLRGNFGDHDSSSADYRDAELDDDVRHEPPAIIGQDERRMQVRAYNHWASLLDNRNFPSIEDLDTDNLPDFGPFSVLLDFTGGIENPAILYLGDKLAEECGTDESIQALDDVPSRSLLSRITDHYMQILANQAPIGFEAEFVNQREATILYRGILLPYSSDDEAIDFIYGVINWKELADQATTDELLLEIDQALAASPEPRREIVPAAPMDEWASDLTADAAIPDDGTDWPSPDFAAPANSAPGADHMELADWLASARELAQAAQGSEDRGRSALYDAIGRAYDFALAAQQQPAAFDELVADSGLTVQDRAPMTPVVKLVFGANYDKTRLTEFAAALGHARRLDLGSGTLAGYLAAAQGGLKGVVSAERRLRREESGKPAGLRETPGAALARKLRRLDPRPLAEVAAEGSEFTLLVARRLPTGEVALLGEISDDAALLERAARRLLA